MKIIRQAQNSKSTFLQSQIGSQPSKDLSKTIYILILKFQQRKRDVKII